MNVIKIRKIIVHSFNMISKNLRSFFLISLSTTLSFVIVLSYLLINDSIIYNKNKTTYMNNPNLYQISYSDNDTHSLRYFLKSIDSGDNFVFNWRSNAIFLKAYSNKDVVVNASLMFMNQNQLGIPYYNGSNFETINITEGKFFNISHNLNNEKVVIVGSSFARSYGGNVLNKSIKLEEMVNGEHKLTDYRIIGVFDDQKTQNTSYDEINSVNSLFTTFILPYNLYTSFDPIYQQNFMVIVSEDYEQILNKAWEFGLNIVSSHAQILTANVEHYTNSLSKGIILLIIFLILGLNAYASNAFSIQKRKKEIGIKLALGITKVDIFKEFFIESLIIMSVNLLLSIVFVINLGVLITLFVRIFIDSTTILYISFSSIIQFLIFSVFLVSINCIIMANQAMNVSPLDNIRES